MKMADFYFANQFLLFLSVHTSDKNNIALLLFLLDMVITWW